MQKSFLLMLCLLLFSGSRQKELIRIMAIGDSITQGGKKSQQEYTYRLPLQMLLRKDGVAFDFIGSRQKGLDEEATSPEVEENLTFDPDHEGYYGHKTADVVRKVKQAFVTYPSAPDIVLIHLGTNDQKGGDVENTVASPLQKLINVIRERNPRAVFLLGHLNFNNSPQATQIREVVEKLATRLNTGKSPVQTVHHYRGWYENPEHIYSDTFDWAHPNLKGQEKMALNWYAAMKPFLKRN